MTNERNYDNTKAIKFYFKDTRFSPNDTATGLFLFLIFQTLVSLVYQVVYLIGFEESIWSYVFTVVLDACFVACVYSITKKKKLNFFEAVKVNKAPTLKQVFICLGISLICIFGFSSITNLFLEVLYRAGYSSVTSDIVIPNFGYYLMYVVLICVMPAVCEEILFRGLICNGLKKIGIAASIFGSAFLFMIMHGSPDQTVHQFILGIILAIAYLISNNLWVPILIHFFNNFIAVTISFVAYGDSEVVAETTEIYLSEYMVYAVISALIATCLTYILLKALSNSIKNEEQEPVSKKSPAFADVDYAMDYNYRYEVDPSLYKSDSIETSDVNGEVIQYQDQLKGDEIFHDDKLNGAGKAMYFISIAWLVMDWISALVVGFSSIY